MELTEKERLMLNEKREEIRRLTTEILEIVSKPENSLEIKKRLTSIQSLASSIASYSNSKNVNLNSLTKYKLGIFDVIKDVEGKDKWRHFRSKLWVNEIYPKLWDYEVIPLIEKYCNFVNSIRFEFTRKDFKITLPKIEIPIFKTEK